MFWCNTQFFSYPHVENCESVYSKYKIERFVCTFIFL